MSGLRTGVIVLGLLAFLPGRASAAGEIVEAPGVATEQPAAAPEAQATPGREPWAATRHPVLDTGSRGVDIALRPVHWGLSTPWWWMERVVYRHEGLHTHVRVQMAAPSPDVSP